VRRTAVYLNCAPGQCGVYEYGRRCGLALARGGVRYAWQYISTDDPSLAAAALKSLGAVACVVANWHPVTLPWYDESWMARLAREQHARVGQTVRFLAVHHDDHPCPHPTVSAQIHPDPTRPESPGTFNCVRLVSPLADPGPPPQCLTVGTMGLAFGGKRFDWVVEEILRCWAPGEARVRMHIPAARHGDQDLAKGYAAVRGAEEVAGPGGTRIEHSWEWLDEESLLRWLAGNSINVFCYEELRARSAGSVLDYALGAGRPVAVTNSWMFRHVRDAYPGMVLGPTRTLRDVLEAGTAPLEPFIRSWTAQALVRDTERACAAVEDVPPCLIEW